MGERAVSLQMVFATALSGLGELKVALQMVFATADGLGWVSVL